MAVSFALLFLLVAAVASCALGAGTAYLIVRKTKKPILWALTPLFALLWLAMGAMPLGFLAYRSHAAPGPTPAPAPIQIAPAADSPTP